MLKKASRAPEAPTAISGDPELVRGIRKAVGTIETLREAHPKGIPARDIFELRSEFGTSASRGNAWKKLPTQPTSAAATAAKDAHETLRRTLHEAIPGLDVVDLNYSTWRKVADALKTAALKEEGRTVAPLGIIVGRQALAGGLGLGVGFGVGGPAGAVLGYGGYAMVANILGSPFWNSLTATQKLWIAKAIEKGAMLSPAQLAAAVALEERTGRKPMGLGRRHEPNTTPLVDLSLAADVDEDGYPRDRRRR